jgi:TonB family protein
MRCSLTALGIAFAAALATAALCTSRAEAAAEFCPALLIGPRAAAAGQDPEWHYHLRALSPRTVEGTIIADTDAGWFTWKQQPVQLTRTTYTVTTRDYKTKYFVAESPELTVRFPQAVAVGHAWVETAATHGEQFFDWDARGQVICAPPDFAGLDPAGPNVTQHTPEANDPTPAPAPATATATASSAPFPTTACAHPFVAATVTDPARPDFPYSVREEGLTGRATSIIYVAVSPNGEVADAWLFSSSGYRALDQSALRAARQSKYAAPLSYCRPVGGTYLFRADFRPL